VERDGNGWVECSQGHRHWGLHGAAGLLVLSRDEQDHPVVLLQHRAAWTHNGDTWGIPGGARDSHETPEQAALREAVEEAALDTSRLTVVDTRRDDHGTWSYVTVLAVTAHPLATSPNEESVALVWTPLDEVVGLDLHPGFERSWPTLHLHLSSWALPEVVTDLARGQAASSDDQTSSPAT
jgi:8-oxo-dGTP pyrophosphatase MutT (NUDIX family)